MDQLCEAMEKLSLSDTKHPKKERPLIRCWKCSELGHIKRFCKTDKRSQMGIRKRRYNDSKWKRSGKIIEKQGSNGVSKGNKSMIKSTSFKLTPSKFQPYTTKPNESQSKEPIKMMIPQNKFRLKRKFIEEDD